MPPKCPISGPRDPPPTHQKLLTGVVQRIGQVKVLLACGEHRRRQSQRDGAVGDPRHNEDGPPPRESPHTRKRCANSHVGAQGPREDEGPPELLGRCSPPCGGSRTSH